MSTSDQSPQTDAVAALQASLKQQLECAFFNIGIEVGTLVKTIVDTEIANHEASIANLKKILTVLPGLGAPVTKNTQSSGETTSS